MFNRNEQNKGVEQKADETSGGGISWLSGEEEKKADGLIVDFDSMASSLRALGHSEKDIEKLRSAPLSNEEQRVKVNELKELLLKNSYSEVVSLGTELFRKKVLTGDNRQAAGNAIGVAAIMCGDKENTKQFAEYAIIGYIRFLGIEDPAASQCALQMMQEGERLVPGCMHVAALKMYPIFRDYFGDEHEYTRLVEKFTI